jgi:TRAP-type mannitol/chloroaromatic compound transport system permease large subunit
MILGVAAALMIVFFFAGLHVASALGLIGMILMYLFSDRPLWDMLGQIAWNVNSSFVLVAVPLFVMMGEILIYSRLSERSATLQHCLLCGVRRHFRVQCRLCRHGRGCGSSFLSCAKL